MERASAEPVVRLYGFQSPFQLRPEQKISVHSALLTRFNNAEPLLADFGRFIGVHNWCFTHSRPVWMFAVPINRASAIEARATETR